MNSPGFFINKYPFKVSVAIVVAGLLIGALSGSTLGCYLYSHHMTFLHEGTPPACGESPVILWGGMISGAFIGAACGLLSVVLIYFRGRCTNFLSFVGPALAVAAFSVYAMYQGRGLDKYLFTGIFVALAGLAVGATVGLILDYLKAKGRI